MCDVISAINKFCQLGKSVHFAQLAERDGQKETKREDEDILSSEYTDALPSSHR